MLKELLNSKMFWIVVAAVLGLILGSITKRILNSKKSNLALSLPFIGLFLTILILMFVKLNVTFFDIKYTILGIGGIVILSLLQGYLMYLSNNKKLKFFSNFTFIYVALCLVIFYVFYKNELVINTNECAETQDIYLLLKKEDAGYFEINPEGIGYIGIQQFTDGFRPKFEKQGVKINSYSSIPLAVEINSKYGIIHAIKFSSESTSDKNAMLNIDRLIDNGLVKKEELMIGEIVTKK